MFLASSVGAVTIANSLFSNSEIKPYFMYTSHTSTLLENVTFTNAIVWNTYISGFLNPKIQLVNVTFYNNTINEFYRHASGLVFCFMCGSIEIKDSKFGLNVLTGTIIEAYDTNVTIIDS